MYFQVSASKDESQERTAGGHLLGGNMHIHTWDITRARSRHVSSRVGTACGRDGGRSRRRGWERKARTSGNVREKFQYAWKFWRPCKECIWAPWLCFGSIFFSYFRYCTGEFPRFITACAIESPLSSAPCAPTKVAGAFLPSYREWLLLFFCLFIFILIKRENFLF